MGTGAGAWLWRSLGLCPYINACVCVYACVCMRAHISAPSSHPSCDTGFKSRGMHTNTHEHTHTHTHMYIGGWEVLVRRAREHASAGAKAPRKLPRCCCSFDCHVVSLYFPMDFCWLSPLLHLLPFFLPSSIRPPLRPPARWLLTQSPSLLPSSLLLCPFMARPDVPSLYVCLALAGVRLLYGGRASD